MLSYHGSSLIIKSVSSKGSIVGRIFFLDNFLYFRRVRTRVKSINNTASIMTRIYTRYHFYVKIKINRSRTCIQSVESHDNESCKY